jgi:hypothetical protein
VGAHAYTIQPACRGDDNAVSGSNITPGHPSSITSNRSESFGAAAICLIALAVEFKYNITQGGYLELHIDNLEVVNRIKFGMDRSMQAEKHMKSDYDIWKETHAIMDLLHSTVCAKWVKAHQDDALVGIGPMPMEAH